MARDSRKMRETKPFLFTNCMTHEGIDDVVVLIKHEVLFEEAAPTKRT
jgi:urease accessory protein